MSGTAIQDIILVRHANSHASRDEERLTISQDKQQEELAKRGHSREPEGIALSNRSVLPSYYSRTVA
jgi:hypothetical protein